MKRALTIISALLLATTNVVGQSSPAVENPGQSLTPELEMAIIRQLNLEERIANRQAILPKRAKEKEDGPDTDVSGEWVCFTTMFLNGPTGKGIMYLDLKQEGDAITGINGQLKHPFDPPSTIRTITERTTQGNITGKWYPGRRHHMVVLERQDGTRTWAIFTAVIAGDGRTAVGQLVNGGGNYGTMLMIRREALSDYQDLLTEEGQQAAEAKRLKGIEQLEAGLSEESLQSAQTFWWKSDKNKDGYLSYEEFPHPDWRRANLNSDEFLTWEEELIDRVLRPLARKGKYQAKYAASSKKEWPSWHEWGGDRPDFEWLFPFIDRDRDGKITAGEYTAFEDQVKTYLDKSFPKTNERGETGGEVYARMTGRSRKTVPSRKSGKTQKTSWDSQEDWNRDKPTVEWVFPFIDKNNDGKIDSDEYQAIQDYKKQHADWQDRARTELGIEPPQGNRDGAVRDGTVLDDARPSVLLINVDDWNDWNQVLRGHPQAVTPHIKRLAERGVVFSNAICSSPMCFPSRTALFSGIHPARSGNITNRNSINPWRTYVPDAVTLPKHLSNQGWKSIGIAKNFHTGDKREFNQYIPVNKKVKEVPGSGSKLKEPRRWAFAAVPTSEMPDYIAVSKGIEAIKSNRDSLFLSLGIYRPHVPWVVPKEYFDKYPLEDIQLPEQCADDLDDLPERFKLLAHNEATFGKDFNKKLVAAGYDKEFVRAYLACVTFADEQLGRLLDAWDASPHAANGYIVLWSDHGYMLGEKEGWSKMKPWYDSAHCNLIFAGPGIPKGAVCNKAVSLQDLYPTLIDLLKLPAPAHKIDGNSLVPLLRNPEADWDKPVVMSSEADGIRYDVVLDNDYRMTRLITGETELYKLADDPHEFNNLARNPEYAEVIERLSQHLTFRTPEIPQDGWIEAEAIPRQTSADYGLRGNCHFPQALQGASGGWVICADLHAGKGSYIDFVLDVKDAGTYALGATLLAGGACTVLVADVVEDAAQADTGYPMENIGTVQGGTGALRDVSFGTATFDEPGLKLVRFMSSVPKQRLQVDRIQFRRE